MLRLNRHVVMFFVLTDLFWGKEVCNMNMFSKKGRTVMLTAAATGVTFGATMFAPVIPAFAETVTVKTADELKNALNNGADSIVVGSDIEGSFEVKSDTSIDLGGNTVNSSGHAFIVDKGANATITNGTITAGNKDAAVYNNGYTTLNVNITRTTSGSNSYYAILNHGEMTINGGTIQAPEDSGSSLIENGYYNYKSTNPDMGHVESVNAAEPTLTINGGNFSGGLIGIKTDEGGVTTINDGKFTNSDVVVQNWNKTTINGGEFESTGPEAILYSGLYNDKTAGALNIEGGKFTGASLVAASDQYTKGASVTLNNADITGVDKLFNRDTTENKPTLDAGDNNELPQITSAEVHDVINWDDKDDQDGVRPTVEQIKRMLTVKDENGNPLNATIDVTVDPDNPNRYLITFVYSADKFNSDGSPAELPDGVELTFDKDELKNAGYTVGYDGNLRTFSHIPEVVETEETEKTDTKETESDVELKKADDVSYSTSTAVSPKTGDKSTVALYTLIAVSAAGACAVAWTIKRKLEK